MADMSLLMATVFLGLLGVALFFLLLRRMTPSEGPPAPPPVPAANEVKESSKEAPAGPPVKIFFGSQTGTAESFAQKLAKVLKGAGLSPKAVDMEDFHAEGMEQLANEPFVIYLMATHGEGDPTDNALAFYEWIKDKSRDDDELQNVKFTCFGLGNTQYEHFNFMGKAMQKHMERLGATSVGTYGEGDDDNDLEGDFNAWVSANVPVIAKHFLGDAAGDVEQQAPSLDYELTVHPEGTSTQDQDQDRDSTSSVLDNQPWLPASLSAVRELQNKTLSGRSTLHVEVSGPEGTSYNTGPYSYVPGDHIGVRCENNPKLVAALGTRLGGDLNSVISLKARAGSVVKAYRFPCPCLLRDCLSKYVDICTPPSQAVLAALAAFAEEDSEKEKLLALGSQAGKTRYTEEIKNKCLTVLEVLDQFPSLKPPLEAVLELLPRLQTRFYSISSSPNAADDSIHLTVAVVRYTTDGTVGDREGVASTWLERMREGRGMQIFMRTSDFHMPADLEKPVLMVGPGTGLAPFRGFIQERQAQRQGGRTRSGGKGAPLTLFFGCRSSKYDYIYQKDLEAAEADGTLQLFTAFSRDQKQKVYVQHLIDQNQEMVHNALCVDGGSMYICGDAKEMARDVQDAMKKAFEKVGGMSADQAVQKMKDLGKERRLCLDVWA